MYIYTLNNGIRCIHQPAKSPVAHCALLVGAGSRDELAGEHGLAHLVEHALFKGTAHRRAHHINSRLENLGGELNAYTTKEETVVHATTLGGDLAKAAELIADVVFRSTFPEGEVAREQAVIVDEINSYRDAPGERIWDEFEDLIFHGSPLGHNILGTAASVRRQSSPSIRAFVERAYRTDAMVFASIGHISEKRWRTIVERCFADQPARTSVSTRTAPPVNPRFEKTLSPRGHQAHCLLGGRAPDAYAPERVALSLLVNILGGPAANSLLNVALRERRGLTYNIEAGYTPFADAGLATIYFSAEKPHVAQCVELIEQQLQQLRTTALTSRKLSMAKKQFMGQLAIALDSHEGAMLGAAKGFLLYNRVDSVAEIRKKIDAVSASQLMEAAHVTFADLSALTYI